MYSPLLYRAYRNEKNQCLKHCGCLTIWVQQTVVMVIFSHQHMPQSKKRPQNILIFISFNHPEATRIRMNVGDEELLSLLQSMCFCVRKIMFRFFIAIRNLHIVFFLINLTREWLLPSVNIFKRFFYTHANMSGNILRCIYVICEGKGNELIFYRAALTYATILHCICSNSTQNEVQNWYFQ